MSESGEKNITNQIPDIFQKAQEFNIETKGKNKEQLIDGIIEFREKQPKIDRFCEYLTGLRLIDPLLLDKLIEDQKVIRAKYGLPNINIIFDDPNQYEEILKKIAQDINVRIEKKSEFGSFFTDGSSSGVYFNNRIGLSIDKSDKEKYSLSISTLEHEIIHSLQRRNQPKMPIEQQEYEANIANFNFDDEMIDILRKNPSWTDVIFRKILISVSYFYEPMEETPIWNNPEYFLTQVDKINEEQLKTHLKHKSIQNIAK